MSIKPRYIQPTLFPEEEFVKEDSSVREEFDVTDLFERLAKSDFRSKFHLSNKDKEYIEEKGLATIRKHAEDFVAKRLAPVYIPNDGKQTPMRGHPVFVAQHACACCCRSCLNKWYRVPQGRALTEIEQGRIVKLLMTWIEREYYGKRTEQK